MIERAVVIEDKKRDLIICSIYHKLNSPTNEITNNEIKTMKILSLKEGSE